MFRELQEGLARGRADQGGHRALARGGGAGRDGIPPFAADPTRKAATYRWSTLVQGTVINYVGMPSTPAAPAWLLAIIEPEAGDAARSGAERRDASSPP